MRDWTGALALTTLAVALEGCSRKKPDATVAQGAVPTCAPTLGTLPADMSLDRIVGEYRLILVASRGPQMGRTVSGTMSLTRGGTDGSLTGRSDIVAETVGATVPGSRPAEGQYQVTALQWTRTPANTPEITIRFGAPTPQAIEGAHLALHLNAHSGTGFTGTWTSGTGQPSAADAGGHFCAVGLRRLSP